MGGPACAPLVEWAIPCLRIFVNSRASAACGQGGQRTATCACLCLILFGLSPESLVCSARGPHFTRSVRLHLRICGVAIQSRHSSTQQCLVGDAVPAEEPVAVKSWPAQLGLSFEYPAQKVAGWSASTKIRHRM